MLIEDFQSKFNQAWALRNQGNYKQAVAIANEYLPIARKEGDKASEALFLRLLAQTHSDKGELREALKYYKQIEHLYIGLKDLAKQMHTLRHIGSIYYELKEFECSEKCLVQVVEAYDTKPPSLLESANTNRAYALAMEARNKVLQAIDHWERTYSLYSELNIEEGIKESEMHLKALSDNH